MNKTKNNLIGGVNVTKIERIKELVGKLHEASIRYYKYDTPIMSDKEYDDLYDELSKLEIETGCILAGSPTQKVQGYVLEGFDKVKHTKPMLSANKTKDIEEVKSFLKNNDFYCSYKLDGLTLVVRYKDGKFIQGITRGSGVEGEDVTEQCRFIKNLPMQIPDKREIELRGECVISWDEFRKINETLDEPYSHPRNLAAGTLRNLDLNVVKERTLSFVVFEIVSPACTHKWNGLDMLEDIGFECVERCVGSVEDCVEGMQPEWYLYPTDGLIFEVNSSELSKSLGATSHHENCRIALKWEDELYETKLIDIEWNTSKTGLINPIAVFEPVDLGGAITTKATLHNISYIENLQLGIGDTIQTYRANMIIPKIHNNLTRSNTWKLPLNCPDCGGNVEIHNENGSKTLHCLNPDCPSKLLGKLTHFVSKEAMNIDGLSEAKLEMLIDKGWLNTYSDIYELHTHKQEIENLEGFGSKSTFNLLFAIEKSRIVDLAHFITAINIPNVGKTSAKAIAEYCKWDFDIFNKICFDNGFDWSQIEGFGEKTSHQISDYFKLNADSIKELVSYLNFTIPKQKLNQTKNNISDKSFCITGKLIEYANRNALVEDIEANGGKVVSSVTNKTDYLISNDTDSASSKTKKAKSLGVPIISEVGFIKMKG